MIMTFWELVITGAILGIGLMFLAVKVFPTIGLLDFPERYGLKREKIPYPGGIIVALLGILSCISFGWDWLALAVFVTLAVSFIDDRVNLPIWPRAITQITVATGIVLLGTQIEQVGNPLTGEAIMLPASVAIIGTIAWIVLVQNAMNWFDGLKGLCVGVSGVGFLALGLFGLVHPEVAWESDLQIFLNIAFAMTGICAGAWILFFQGKILLGDSGSQTLGLLLGVLSIAAGTKLATTLLVLGLPLLDAVVVMFRRILIDKKSPLKGDQQHLHHTLAKRVGEKTAVLVLLFCSALLGIGSIFLPGWGKILGVAIVSLSLVAVHFKIAK